MSAGVKKANNAHIGVGITGIAGPGGATPEKRVGLVYISVNEKVKKKLIFGCRLEIRQIAVSTALEMIYNYITENY